MKTLSGEELQKGLKHLEVMKEYEYTCEACSFICGIDEADRGSLAGLMVAGAVILPKDCRILYLNDSKKVSEKKRELLFDEIRGKAVSYDIGVVGPGRIDEINIFQATYEAMREAVSQLRPTPEILLSDTVTIPGVDLMQIPVMKGDAKSASIATASILAKVTRDKMVVEYDALYPEYGFVEHKGYGTAVRIQALREHRPCPIHGKSLIKSFV